MVFPAQHSSQSLRLPSPPMVLSRLLKMLAEDRSSATELAEVILEDPGLTARILRVANSPFYNFSNKIVTVSHAIALLGCQSIRILCASESFLGIFPRRKGSFTVLFQKYCQHSLATALLAKIMAEETDVSIDSEKVFIAGLLHDIGKPVLWYNFLDQASAYHDFCSREISERDAERLAYGVDHTEAGASVAGEWGLDSELAKVMARHHESRAFCGGNTAENLSEFSLSELVGLADILSRCLEYKDDQMVFGDAVENYVLRRLVGLDWQKVVSVFVEQAPVYGLEQVSGRLATDRKPYISTTPATDEEVDAVDHEADYEVLLQRSLTLFKAYSSFLENFKLNDIFAGIIENLGNLPGVDAVSIMLYKTSEQSLTVRTASGEASSERLGRRLLLVAEELDLLQQQSNLLQYFDNYSQKVEPGLLECKLKDLFLSSEKNERGVFLPVYSERRLVGAFCLKLKDEGDEDNSIFRELLFGHAVQLALAIRFYHLSHKLQVLRGSVDSSSSALVMGHALKIPLKTLRENIYMLNQESRNAGFSRSGYSHIYCQKMDRALAEVNAVISRYTSSSKDEINLSGSQVSKKVLS
ncbi:MAG: HDOD domain-containing protein [Deltaproteobacteria bacterium]|nr:HDOD domain-containing protein [Candidatus Tharpella sp.]